MKIIRPMLSVVALLMFCNLFSYAQLPDSGVQITIEAKPSNPSDQPIKNKDPKPRSLVEPDIEAYYYCGVITFTFNVDFGYANIVVRNVATGDEWYDSYSGYGSTSITLNGDSGYYEVTIYTDNGDYIGNFII